MPKFSRQPHLMKVARRRLAMSAQASLSIERLPNAAAYEAACAAHYDWGEPAPPGIYLDPVAYCIEVLGFTPWGRQAGIARALPEHRRISVRSGNKIGKSKIAAGLALWFYDTYQDARVIMTAPTYRQVVEVLWREVLSMHRKAKRPIIGERNISPATGIRHDENQIVGLSTDEPEKFSGWSGANLLYIGDEASGIDDAIFEAIEGGSAGDAWLALFSNPTQLTGEFHASHTTKAGTYHCEHVSSSEAADWQVEHGEIPGLATHKWIKLRAEEWGKDSPMFIVRVDGNFPSKGSNAVIPLDLLLAAYDRRDARDVKRLKVGVDVARFGDDDSVIQPVRGHRALQRIVIHGQDTMAIADAVVNVVQTHRQTGDEKPIVNVDEIGVGAGVLDRLVRLGQSHGFIATGVNVAETSDDPDRFKNLRSQLWFSTLKWLEEGGCLLHKDAKLTEELTGVRYTMDERGRYVVEKKDAMKARIGRSPDRADALNLAVYGKYSGRLHKRSTHRSAARRLAEFM